MKRMFFASLAVLVLAFAPVAHGTPLPLVNNGGGLIYDPNLKITWYYAGATSTTWSQAMSWAAGLNVGGVTGWTLPATLPVNGSTYNYTSSYNGSTDYGYNISAPGSAYPGSTGSEMAYLYYVELGNIGSYDINGNARLAGYGLVKTGLFTNLAADAYWSSTQVGQVPAAFLFFFNTGQQYSTDETLNRYAGLAVHSGDVGAPVPVPASLLLLGPGLVGLAAMRRRFKG
jgi:hypothetical protein